MQLMQSHNRGSSGHSQSGVSDIDALHFWHTGSAQNSSKDAEQGSCWQPATCGEFKSVLVSDIFLRGWSLSVGRCQRADVV